jgi:hypothetical protein
LALRIIFDSIGERPIYFTAAGGMLTDLGLERWAVRSGLVTQFVPRSLEAPQPDGWVRGSDAYGGVWFDLDHSLALYDEVYEFRGIRDRAIWQDRSTMNIPLQYYATALQLSDAAERDARPSELVERLRNDAVQFQLVAAGGLALSD